LLQAKSKKAYKPRYCSRHLLRHVIPAKAGIQENIVNLNKWIPAFAGMTCVFFTVTVYELTVLLY
jgi:hypothetical protein